jgi:hypothetical protein
MKNDKKQIVVSNEKLKVLLSKVGNTPIDEPELAKVFDKKPLKKMKALNIVFKREGFNVKDFTAVEVAEFFHALNKRVMDKRDENGIYKTTPNTVDFKLPDFEEVEKLTELLTQLHMNHSKQESLTSLVVDGEDVDSKKVDALVEELTDILTKMDDLVWSITGLDKEKLTDWEQVLMTEQILSTVSEIQKTSMGKQ